MAPHPDDFDRRLGEARRKRDESRPERRERPRNAAIGAGFRIATELVGGVLIGALIGWALDKWLGSSPWLLILFLMLGFGAGINNVIRATARLDQEMSAGGIGKDLPPGGNDEDI